MKELAIIYKYNRKVGLLDHIQQELTDSSEGTSEENIIPLIDSLSAQVKVFLLITRLKKGPNI